MNLFYRIYKNSFGRLFTIKLWSYGDISLRLFLDIAVNGNFEALIIKGRVSFEQCLERWEEIIQRNSEENSTFQYLTYLSLQKGYNTLLAHHTKAELLLIKASLVIDQDVIDELLEMGYKLNYDLTSDQLKEIENAPDIQKLFIEKFHRTDNYARSIEIATRKAKTLVTKINMKKSELAKYNDDNKKGKPQSFEDIIANLEVSLGDGRNLPDDITLAKFNSLRKMASKKQAAASKIGKR